MSAFEKSKLLFRNITTVCFLLLSSITVWSNPMPASGISELNDKAQSFLELGDYVNAYKNAFSAREEAIYQNNQEEIARAVRTIGNSFYYLADFQASLRYYEQALMIYQSLNDIQMQAQVISNISSIYSELLDFDTAIEMDMKALSLVKGTDFEDDFIWLKVNLAYDLGRNQEFDNAISQYKSLIRPLEEEGNKNYLNYLYRQLSEIYRRSGDTENALQMIDKAIALAQENQSDELLYGSYLEKAEIYLAQNLPDQAIQHTNEALDYFQNVQRRSLIIQAYSLLHRANEAVENFKAAAFALKNQKEIEDEIESIKSRQYSKVLAIEKQVKEQKDALKSIQNQKDQLIANYSETVSLLITLVVLFAFFAAFFLITTLIYYRKFDSTKKAAT
ncbi:tetratricopeptide repeat protein [Pleionea sediminis]|uniref:tetratricopeptide repeat protein n=1 Tax=Pleionea sediminis TaxID=2569479 RepID=UPI001184AA44|nr:tetratricopeptide repeat protein [Pleionea sediminis]